MSGEERGRLKEEPRRQRGAYTLSWERGIKRAPERNEVAHRDRGWRQKEEVGAGGREGRVPEPSPVDTCVYNRVDEEERNG